MIRSLALAPAVAVAGCGPVTRTDPAPRAADAPVLVVAERGPSGGRLVAVAPSGERVADLTRAAGETVRDNSPAFSPDGRWIAFVSSRGRAFDESSLWVIEARPGATPVRLTDDGLDVTPAWTPDGAIVFASTRAGSRGFDLWRLELAVDDAGGVAPAGEPGRLTDLAGHELSPSIAADGAIAFARFDDGAGGTTSRIAVRAPGGAIRDLTSGPADSAPAWSPDGAAIAFTAPNLRVGADGAPAVDGDLWLIPAGGGEAHLLVDAPDTDESTPVWSKDGRWVFATSTYRAARTGKALFSAIVYVDRWEAEPRVRMLVDRAGAVPRLGVAVAPVILDAGALHRGPAYREKLAEIVRRAYEAR